MATLHLPTPITTDKIISAALWTAQVVLASIFAVDGIINLTVPADRIAEVTSWLASAPVVLVRIVGGLEILGAVSLMLPTSSRALTHTAGVVAAAFAAMTLINFAAGLHAATPGALALDLTVFLSTALVAWERLRVHHDERA